MEPTPDYIVKLNMLPYYMRDGMKNWIEEGIFPGSFLTAILRNKPWTTVLEAADDTNRNMLWDYGIYLYNYAPGGCHGSDANFDDWAAKYDSVNDTWVPGGLRARGML